MLFTGRRKSHRPVHWLVIAATCLLTTGSMVVASPDVVAEPAKEIGRAEAKRLLRAGTAAYARRDYNGALVDFQKAYAAFPSARIQYNLGQTLRELGRPVEATTAFEAFLTQADRITPQQRKEATAALKDLDSQVARVTVITNVAQVEVAIDGVSRGKTPLPGAVVLAPGTHVINLTRADYGALRESITVSGGEQRRASFMLERSASAAVPPPAPSVIPSEPSVVAPPAPAPEPARSASSPVVSEPTPLPSAAASPSLAAPAGSWPSETAQQGGGSHKVVGGTLLAASAALAVGGAVLLGASWFRFNEAKDSGCNRNCGPAADQVEARALWSKILFGAAALTGVAGTTVFLAFPDEPPSRYSGSRASGVLLVGSGTF
jgi:hypothetical protein